MILAYRPESRFARDDTVVVSNGSFQTKDLAGPDSPMNPGTYKITVMMDADQPANVVSITGSRGEKLTGPHIRLVIDQTFSQEFRLTIPGTPNQAQDAKFKQISRDQEVSGIGRNCQELHDSFGLDHVQACIDRELKTVPP